MHFEEEGGEKVHFVWGPLPIETSASEADSTFILGRSGYHNVDHSKRGATLDATHYGARKQIHAQTRKTATTTQQQQKQQQASLRHAQNEEDEAVDEPHEALPVCPHQAERPGEERKGGRSHQPCRPR